MDLADKISTDHKDVIHDVAFNFYGRRMATCSSDQTVKVFDVQPDGTWKLTNSVKTHSASVWKITWAHPEMGQVLATCSFDRSVQIWEEIPSTVPDAPFPTQWIKRASNVDARTSVTDIKFAPRHYGFKLAACESAGIVRLYEACDIMNLGTWTLKEEIATKLGGCATISWCQSRSVDGLLVVGSAKAVDSSVSGAPDSNATVHVYERYESENTWKCVVQLSHVTDPVQEVAFAPYIGRSYHTFAVASTRLHIITMQPNKHYSLLGAGERLTYSVKEAQVNHPANFEGKLWRLSWNITGTVLVTSSEDGYAQLWKRQPSFNNGTAGGEWCCERRIHVSGGLATVDDSSLAYAIEAPYDRDTSQTPSTGAAQSKAQTTAKFSKHSSMTAPPVPWIH